MIFITCASRKEARGIADTLLRKRLAACANIISGIESKFRWKGRIDKAGEILLILKTKRKNFDKIENEVRRLHSYEVPEIIAVPIIAGSKSYLRWLKRSIMAVFSAVLLLSSGITRGEDMTRINLPEPKAKGNVSVEEAIGKRRSVRSYASKDISVEDVSQLLWACQGITDKARGHRAAPSAGALYPLEIYLVKSDGIFHYIPKSHSLEAVSKRDSRSELAAAAYGQGFVEEAAIDIVICAVYERVTSKYGERGVRYTDMEAGHAAENVFLQAVALGLDSLPVGAFSDSAVAKVLQLPKETKPLYILPVGYKK